MNYTKYLVFTTIIIFSVSAMLSSCDTKPVEVDETVTLELQIVAPKEETKKLTPGSVYAISELLYFSGTDISASDPRKQYRICEDGGIDIISSTTQEVLESYEKFEYSEIEEEKWNSLFTGGLELDISGYKQKTLYTNLELYTFYILDDEVWLGTFIENELMTVSKLLEVNPVVGQ